jgi:hypothetical protein
LSVKKFAVVATAALALVAGASVTVSSALAADGSAGSDALVASGPAGTPKPPKDLFIKTNNAEIQSVTFFVDGRWTECIQTPDPNTPAAAGVKVGPETVSLRGFSSDNCFEGVEQPGQPGKRHTTQIYTGYADVMAVFDAEPDRVVVTPF